MPGPNEKIVFESDQGLLKIKREANEAAKALERLNQIRKEVIRQGGEISRATAKILDQQSQAMGQGIPGAPRGVTGGAAGGVFAKVGRVVGQAVGGRAGGIMSGGATALRAGGPWAAAAFVAAKVFTTIAKTAKDASDKFVKFDDRLTDVARSMSGFSSTVTALKSSMKFGGAAEMRRFGFGPMESLAMRTQLGEAGGLRGATAVEGVVNQTADLTRTARMARFMGMGGQQAAGLTGRLRGAGFQGEDPAGFLGALGQRARTREPAFAGRMTEYLRQLVDFSKETATVLKKGERKQAISMFGRIMEGLSGGGAAQFTGEAGKRLISSVDEVMKSGQGILGGMFSRFLVAKVAREGGTQTDVVKMLDQGIFADGGRPLFEMVDQMTAAGKSIDRIAHLLSAETGRPFLESEKFLKAILDPKTTATEEDFKEAMEEFNKFDPKISADRQRKAQASMEAAMIRFGESVPIFRNAAELMGDVAGLMLKDDREDFMESFLGANRLDKSSMEALGKIGERYYEQTGREPLRTGLGIQDIKTRLSIAAQKILKDAETSITPRGRLNIKFGSVATEGLGMAMGLDKGVSPRGQEGLLELIIDFKKFMSARTWVPSDRIKISLEDAEGSFQANGTGTNEKK